MDIKSTFAARLKELRGNMKQEEFGAKIGVSRGSISYYENGARTADIVILEKICKEYNVSADWLLGFTDIVDGNADNIAVEQRFGLSFESIRNLDVPPHYFDVKEFRYILDKFIGHRHFHNFLRSIAEYKDVLQYLNSKLWRDGIRGSTELMELADSVDLNDDSRKILSFLTEYLARPTEISAFKLGKVEEFAADIAHDIALGDFEKEGEPCGEHNQAHQ